MAQNLFVIEGLDGSGKATQTKLLCHALTERGFANRYITFPDYASESSALVRLYLNGEFGANPGDVNGYAAASFYAVDRYASYHRDWKQDYASGNIIVADRYVTSNLIYQMSKVEREEKDTFLAWVEDYEYGKLGLPQPTATIYLDMQPEISQRLLQKRYAGDEAQKDIHERDVAYLLECRRNALYSAAKCGWHIVRCDTGKDPKPVEQVHSEVLELVLRYLHDGNGGDRA